MSTKLFETKGSGKIDFIGKAKIFTSLSVLAVLASLGFWTTQEVNYGVDFAGGTEMQIQFSEAVETNEVRKLVDELGLTSVQIQEFPEDHEFLIRFQTEEGATVKETTDILNKSVDSTIQAFQTTFEGKNPTLRRVDTVGPQVGDQLKKNSILALFYSFLSIMMYVSFRFDYVYAPGAVICLIHDAIVVAGIVAALGKEINVQILAALLTIIGYSINDTIVIFDRVRENLQIDSDPPLPWVINKSINETLSRTINTSFTTLITTICLFLFADGVIRDFAFAMSLGILVGTYSTIYVASPVVIITDRLFNKKKYA